MHIRHSQKCHAGNIPLHRLAPWWVHCHRVLPHIDCCLERHTSILLHQRRSTILSLHCALTAPDCRPAAVCLVRVWSLFLFLCLAPKSSHRWTKGHPQWLWVLIVEQTVLTWHCMLSCLIDLSVHWILPFGMWECVFVCDCARTWIVYANQILLTKITSFARFSCARGARTMGFTTFWQ